MSIDERLDRLLNVDPAPDAPISEEAPAPDLPQEPIQVAGLGKALKGLLSGGKKAAQDAPSAPAGASAIPTPPQPSAAATPAAPTPKLSDPKAPDPVADRAKQIFPPVKEPPPGQTPIEKLITPAKADDIKQKVDIRDATERPATGKPPEELFNFMRTGLPDDANTFIDEAAKAAGVTAPTRVTHAEVLADLQAMGYKAKDLDWITNYADNTEQMRKVAMAREVLVSTAKMTQELAKQLTNAPTPELAAKYHQATVMLGQLSRGVKNIQTDYARALGVMRATPDGDAFALADFVNNIGGLDNVVAHAGKLAKMDMDNLANIKRAADLAEVSIWTKLKNIWVTTWINGLLSSPVTHAKNILGNELFLAMNVAERFNGALIGRGFNAINKLTGRELEEMVEMDEALAMISGVAASQLRAFSVAARAFRENKAITPGSKLDDAVPGTQNLSDFGGYLGLGGLMGRAADLYGRAVTLPGRGLLSADEYFKTQGYYAQLYALAKREAAATRRKNLADGMDPKEAFALEKQRFDDILANPPEDINAASWDFARAVTFTEDLEHGSAGKAAMDLASKYLIVKMHAPFIKTPVNVASEMLDRTPFAGLTKDFWGAIKAGGIERDMALSKVATGTSMILAAGTLAAMGRLTGGGSPNPNERYSIVFRKDEVDDESFRILEDMQRVTVIRDKVYVSYKGLEPVGGLLAIGSDYADYARYQDNVTEVEQVAMGSAIGIAKYMTELPYLQGMADFVEAITGGQNGEVGPESIRRVVDLFAQKGTEFLIGGSPAGAFSSARAAVERMIDPTVSNVRELRSTDIGVKGVLEAINIYKSRTPGLSGSLPPKTNRWGEPIEYGSGNPFNTISPLRINRFDQNDADVVWRRYRLPEKDHSDVIGYPIKNSPYENLRVELTGEEFNFLKKTYATIKIYGMTVEEAIVEASKTGSFLAMSLPEQQKKLLSINDKYMDAATKVLVLNSKYSTEIERRFEERKNKAEEFGLFSKKW